MAEVERFRLMCFTSPELRSASSYGHFTAAKEFRSQCHIFRFWNNQSRRMTIIHDFNGLKFACNVQICECPNLRMSKSANDQKCQNANIPKCLLHFFKFGENRFRSSARGECPACEISNFEFLYLAEAPAGNYPPAKYRIPIFYIWIGRKKSITRQRQKQKTLFWNIL